MGKTIAQKIFDAHLVERSFGEAYVLRLDAVFCHEITTPIAIADLVEKGMDRVFDASKIKAVIDHVTPAKDSKTALQGKMLRDWARRHGIKDFFDIGRNGVCHALFPEKGFARPSYTIIMGDSHTCTHDAFGAFAAGVGSTDLEVGILKGVVAKDVILRVIQELGASWLDSRTRPIEVLKIPSPFFAVSRGKSFQLGGSVADMPAAIGTRGRRRFKRGLSLSESGSLTRACDPPRRAFARTSRGPA